MAGTWSLAIVAEAKQKAQFVLVPEGELVNILDAPRLWQSDSNIVLQTGYRLAGTPSAITTTLTALNFPLTTIQDVLNSSISSKNYLGLMSTIFDEEVSKYNHFHKAAVNACINSQGYKLFDLMTMINPDLLQLVKTKKAAATEGLPVLNIVPGALSSMAKTPDVKLAARIPAVDSGKVLDVSNLTERGTGARVVATPKPGKKLLSSTLALAANDLDHYMLAISLLPGGTQRYLDDVNNVRASLGLPALEKEAVLERPVSEPAMSPSLASYHPPSSEIAPTKIKPLRSKKEYNLLREKEELEKQKAAAAAAVVANPSTFMEEFEQIRVREQEIAERRASLELAPRLAPEQEEFDEELEENVENPEEYDRDLEALIDAPAPVEGEN